MEDEFILNAWTSRGQQDIQKETSNAQDGIQP